MHDPELKKDLRSQFPLLNEKVNGNALIYLDNAATTQKPACVIAAEENVYKTLNANVHRAAHTIASKATDKFEQTRYRIANFIHASCPQEIIFTSGTTQSVNLVAASWGRKYLKKGDEILLTVAEHHANIVPWQEICLQQGASLKVVGVTSTGLIDQDAFNKALSDKTKLVAIHHVSNVIGKVNPVKDLVSKAKQYNACVFIDAAQSAAHFELDVQALNCDFLAFSLHKMYGPTGVGVLFGKKNILEAMPPYQTGGEMIKKVSFSHTTFNELPFKFEAGTPNIAGIIAAGEAISFIENQRHLLSGENALTHYFYQEISKIEELELLFEGCPDLGIFSFRLRNHHQQDFASFLDANGVAVRAGHHCAMPLMEHLKLDGSIRISIAPYNTLSELARVISLIKQFLSDEVELTDEPLKDTVTINIVELFRQCKGWDERHRQIMLLGKSLMRMSKENRNEHSLIDGCESQAWLIVNKNSDGTFLFEADSDAKIIRGLLVIVLAAVNGHSAKTINAFDFHQYFETLGLLQHLSPSRGNGLLSIVNKIKRLSNAT